MVRRHGAPAAGLLWLLDRLCPAEHPAPRSGAGNPALLFLLNALLLGHWALGLCAVLFAWAHLTITWQCAKEPKEN